MDFRHARVLLTSVCRPIGPAHGDGTTVGYELLHRQVTRAQGIFSPRATHLTFGLDYIAANLDAPTVVLHYPSKDELVKELRKGPEYVGISFILATFHRMKEMAALIREHAPQAKIVLGGYGTVLDDGMLAPHSDRICREEGVGFFRALLGEPPRAMPYDHPLVVSTLRVLSAPVGQTGMIFAGLGCPHGCDFCCTSHFFKRRHIRLLPTGDDVFRVIERYLEINPKMSFTILDEDFLVVKDRAARLRELVQKRGTPLSIFAFASVKALSRYTPRELLETGIDGVWIGYEGTRSGFAKQQGRPVHELIPELRSHGITVLTSMILGFDYQTPEIIREELAGLLALRPAFSQFLIYGPTPGTPFFDRVVREGRFHQPYADDPVSMYRKADGFTAVVRHPTLAPAEIEALQQECFEADYRTLGPSIIRAVEAYFEGWKRYHDSDSPYLRAKAVRWAQEIRGAIPVLRVARRHGPIPEATARFEAEIESALGPPNLWRRFLSVLAPVAASWTRYTLTRDRFQHPKVRRNAYRTSPWALRTGDLKELRVRLERAVRGMVVSLDGALDRWSARKLAAGIKTYLRGTQGRIELVIADGTSASQRHLRLLGKKLRNLRHRLSVVVPAAPGNWSQLSRWFEVRPATNPCT
ncbi:MAG: cobalamin B12-binding domain-containing protein [Planctomycetes bacterium]|nr:cobalamin B12-binding domain-containing protein [Planctomycetota bacterium]